MSARMMQGDCPKGYKQTEVGVIPEDWSVIDYVSFGQVIDGDRGFHYPGAGELSDNGHCLFLNAGNVTKAGFRFGECQFISAEKDKKLNKGKLTRGDVVLTTRGTIGNFAYYGDDITFESIRINSGMVILRNLSPMISTAYQYLVLRSHVVDSQIERLSFGSAQPQLTVKGISTLKFPLPPTKAEQEAIAEALSDADAHIESLEQLIAKKRQVKQGAMQELLTGKRRLPGFSGEWKVVSMREILTQKATYGIVTAGTFVHNGVKMLRGGDIFDGRINTELPMVSHAKATEYSRTALVKNDVVVALVGYPGAAAKIPMELVGANISRAVGLLRLNGKASPDYLVCFLNSPDGRRMVLAPSAGSAQQVVNLAALNKLQFTIPPIPEQTAIAAILSDMDAEIAELEAKLAKARQVKQGMMQELLTGRIRLV